MAMTLTGFVYDNAGNAISGATVQGYVSADDQTSGTTAEASTTTNSDGKWSITTSTAARIPMDVLITYGSNKRWIKAGDKVNVTDMTVTGTLTVGEDAAGFDFSLFSSDTSGDGLTWDASEEVLQITGKDANTALDVLDGDVRIVDKLYFYDRGGEYLSSDGSTLTITGAVTIGALSLSSMSSNWTNASRTVADMGIVTTIDINGGTIDGAVIGGASAAAITGTTGTFSGLISANGGITFAAGDDIAFTGSTGTNDITLTDSLADALSITRGGTDMVVFNSSTPSITFTPVTTFTGAITASSDLTVTGNLTVSGTTTTVDTTNTVIKDALIKLAQGTTASPAVDLGFIFTRGNGSASNIANRAILWDESADQFAFAFTNDEDGTTSGNVDIDDYADIKVGNVIVDDEVQTANIGYTDGDNSMTIADGGKVTFAAGFAVGSDAEGDVLYSNGTNYVRLARGSDADVLTLASGVPSWATPTTGDITGVTAGVGLSGGGSSGAVTLTLDLSELSTVTPADGDFFATLDSDGANEQKTTTTALATLMAGTVTSTGISASSSVLTLDIQNMTASTTIADADLVVIDDGAGGTLRKMTRANFIESAALDAINIDGGAIDGAVIGANSAAAITGTTVDAGTDFTIGDTVITDGVITDTSGLQVAAAVDLVANTLTTTGSLQVRTIDYSDGDLAMTIADGGGVTFAQQVSLDKSILVDSTPANTVYSGITGTFTAGETLSVGECVYLKAADTKMWKAVSGAGGTGLITAEIMCVAVAAEAITADAAGVFLLQGFITSTAFPTYAIGETLYLPEAEQSSLNVPEGAAVDSTGDFVQVLGWASAANTIFFNPDFTIIEHA